MTEQISLVRTDGHINLKMLNVHEERPSKNMSIPYSNSSKIVYTSRIDDTDIV